jgi:hypothetical protein
MEIDYPVTRLSSVKVGGLPVAWYLHYQPYKLLGSIVCYFTVAKAIKTGR